MLNISRKHRLLLIEVLLKHRPELLGLLRDPEPINLTPRQLHEIIDVVTDEMLTTGLQDGEDGAELSPAGVDLDDLITGLLIAYTPD